MTMATYYLLLTLDCVTIAVLIVAPIVGLIRYEIEDGKERAALRGQDVAPPMSTASTSADAGEVAP